MRPSGTEPGDFVEFDYDLIEAERRQRIREVLHHVRADLEKEIGSPLEVSNDGNDLVLVADGEIRFPGSSGARWPGGSDRYAIRRTSVIAAIASFSP